MLNIRLFDYKIFHDGDLYCMFIIQNWPIANHMQQYFTVLRKCLLFHFSHFAIAGVKIPGIKSEFSNLVELEENVMEFILHLQTLKLAGIPRPTTFKFAFQGPGKVFGKDLDFGNNLKVINPNTYIASVLPDYKFYFEVKLLEGSGYKTSEEIKNYLPPKFLALNTCFSPLRKMSFTIANKTSLPMAAENLEYGELHIQTNGTITPQTVLVLGSVKYRLLFMTPQQKLNLLSEGIYHNVPKNPLLTEFPFSQEALMVFEKNYIFSISDLTKKSLGELRKLNGMDEISFYEIKDFLLNNS